MLQIDDFDEFRLAQLLLLLRASASFNRLELDIDRIAAFDFLSANPFLLVDGEDEAYSRLRLAGFGAHSISYAAPGHRFATRRGRILHDLSMLVAYGLISVESGPRRRYVVTQSGVDLAERLTSTYADAYRASAHEVMSRLGKTSDSRLREQMTTWLHGDPLLFDLLDHADSGGDLNRD